MNHAAWPPNRNVPWPRKGNLPWPRKGNVLPALGLSRSPRAHGQANGEARETALKSVRAHADSSTMVDERVWQRVDGNLAWARDEVVVLLGTIALPGEDRVYRLVEHLGRLTEGTHDAGRRLALLLQMGAAMSGVFESVDRLAGVDPLDLADDLFALLQADSLDATDLFEVS